MKWKNRLFKDTESTLYCLGIIIALIVIVVFLSFDFILRKNGYSFAQECLFRRLTGLYCPGCGGTRSLLMLMHGNILQSLFFNPFVTYSSIICCIFYVSQTLSRITKGHVKGMKFRRYYLYIGIIILASNFIIKNYYLLVLGTNLIE